jgi:glycogen debranching enzyme
MDFLTDAYGAAVNTMAMRKTHSFDTAHGLFQGPGFMNDGISAYPSPPWQPGAFGSLLSYPGVDQLMCLSTNCLYYGAYQALANMAGALGKTSDASTYQEAGATLRSAVNDNFWQADSGTYGYLIQGPQSSAAGQLDPSQEGGGLALAVLMGIASPSQTRQLLANAHWEPHGVVNVWPNPSYFPSGQWGRQASLWPMVHSMFGHAAALGGRTDLFARAMTDLAQLVRGSNDRFYEIYNPTTGVLDGGWQSNHSGQITHWTSQPDQAWSATGYLRMVYRALFGLTFTTQGLTFAPSLPSGWGTVSLTGVRYRDATLDITLTGAGDTVRSVTVDETPHPPLLAAGESGHHSILITLTTN